MGTICTNKTSIFYKCTRAQRIHWMDVLWGGLWKMFHPVRGFENPCCRKCSRILSHLSSFRNAFKLCTITLCSILLKLSSASFNLFCGLDLRLPSALYNAYLHRQGDPHFKSAQCCFESTRMQQPQREIPFDGMKVEIMKKRRQANRM